MNQAVKLAWRSSDTPQEIAAALRLLESEYPISENGRGLKLSFRKTGDSETVSRVSRSRGSVLVEYSTLSGALRGVGSALAKLDGEERTPFKKLGIMLDVSRNMVMRVEHFKKWLRRLALCGCNEVQIYSEDTFELDDEPFFGAYRAPYTLEELQEMDDYADQLGIELVGSVQTLGHMEQVLQHKHYQNITDSERIMLVDSPDTEKLIRKIISFWKSALRSSRIHVGMDEAHGLGRGKHQTLYGAEKESSLMTRHLKVVSEICKEYGMEPMIWSDMFFRMTNENHDYYDFTSPFPKGIQKEINPDVSLVYWDYYHKDAASYRKMIARHRELGKEPIMASGIWTWSRLWYDHRETMETVIPCIDVCRQEKISELFFTMWGDDGAYCNYDSSLAGIVRCRSCFRMPG
ncbi:MAG: beta-N-acetylhexosaminidase [Lentisphaerae bacterium]|nr:beta-N-acetylhexosaminidase [Lentisphaerota bacterium]